MQNIFVSNLSISTSEQALRALFAAFGQVLSVNVVNDRDTEVPRGFAFIEMGSDAEAQAAIAALDGTIVDGRRVSVNQARPKKSDASTIQQRMRRHRDHRY